MSVYRRTPFKISGKRKKRKQTENKIDKESQKKLDSFNSGSSWFNQEVEDTVIINASSSSKKIKHCHIIDSGSESDDEEKTQKTLWIVDMINLSDVINECCVCKECGFKITISEKISERTGLGTKFSIICSNPSCPTISLPSSFHTTLKQGHVYDINRKSVLASRIIGKGRSGLNKLCSVIGLASPVSKPSFAEHTKFWEKVAEKVKEESFNEALVKIKEIKQEQNDEDAATIATRTLDVATSFDGSWSSRGWTANKGIVSAISEETCQVIDVSYKCRTCIECTKMEEKRKSGLCSRIEFLDWYIDHEINCFKNHDSSPQVISVSCLNCELYHDLFYIFQFSALVLYQLY